MGQPRGTAVVDREPRSTRSAVARSDRSAGHPTRPSSSSASTGRPRIARCRGAGWHRRRAPASWPPRPRRRLGRPPPREQVEPERRPAGPLPERRRLGRPIPARLDTSRTPSSRSSGRMCRVTTGDSSPMTVASDAAKRSVTGGGRDATTSARPRPESAVARTRKWHRAKAAGRPTGGRRRTGPRHAAGRAGDGPTRRSGWRRGRRPRRPGRAGHGRSDPRWSPRASEQRGGRGQRHARLGLVAGAPVDSVAVERPPGFVQEPRLPDPGVPHEEQRADAPFAPRRSDQRANGRHLVRPTDEHLAHAVRLRRGAIVLERPRSPEAYEPARTWTCRRLESPPNPPAWTQ